MDTFNSILKLIADGVISELEAERLLNAMARLESGVPTGTNGSRTKNTHTL